MKNSLLFLFLLISLSSWASAQEIQVNRQNKTIAVTAQESVEVSAEIAVIEVGYYNFAATKDAAYDENVKTANTISNALLNSGIPKEAIETQKLQLEHVEPGEKYAANAEFVRQHQFEAQQSWKVTVPIVRSQAVVDLAVRNGANEISDVEWNVTDPVALQAKAGGAALAKARRIAEQMAAGLGTKLGELVYASNQAPVSRMWSRWLATDSAEVSTTRAEPQLTLFPQKVKSEATVYAVFAIE